MIIVRMSSNGILKISNKPDNSVIYRGVDGDYFLGTGKYDREYIGGNLKVNKLYYFGIKLEVVKEEVHIFEQETYFISFDEEGNISDKVKYIPECFDLKHVRELKGIYLWHLLFALDIDSVEGRRVIMKNYTPNFNLGSGSNDLKLPTKVCNTGFCIEEESFKEVVSLDKVVGTEHPSYSGLSWIDIFCNLKRTRNIVESLLDSKYYNELESGMAETSGLSFIKVDNEYYISQGTHRITIAKLKGIKEIYASVCYYKTSTFHRDYYNKLSNLGFDIRLCGREHTYYNILTDYNCKYDWEVFEVSLNNERIILFNEEMIYKFYATFVSLDVNDKAVKFRDYYNAFKKVYSVLMPKKFFDSDDEWYDKYITSAIENFFISNNKLVSEHKKNLNTMNDLNGMHLEDSSFKNIN